MEANTQVVNGKILADHSVRQSMSSTGSCFDNAVAESFFASLKKELVHRVVFATRTEAYDQIAEYINLYNTRRLDSTNGYVAPIDRERLDKPDVAAQSTQHSVHFFGSTPLRRQGCVDTHALQRIG